MVLGSHRRRIKKPAGDECLATRMGRGLHLVPKICSNQNPIGAMAFWVALIWGKWFSSRLLQHQKLKAVLIWCWKTSTFRFATLSIVPRKKRSGELVIPSIFHAVSLWLYLLLSPQFNCRSPSVWPRRKKPQLFCWILPRFCTEKPSTSVANDFLLPS